MLTYPRSKHGHHNLCKYLLRSVWKLQDGFSIFETLYMGLNMDSYNRDRPLVRIKLNWVPDDTKSFLRRHHRSEMIVVGNLMYVELVPFEIFLLVPPKLLWFPIRTFVFARCHHLLLIQNDLWGIPNMTPSRLRQTKKIKGIGRDEHTYTWYIHNYILNFTYFLINKRRTKRRRKSPQNKTGNFNSHLDQTDPTHLRQTKFVWHAIRHRVQTSLSMTIGY